MSVGQSLAQAILAAGQFALALWLTPTQLGLWAIATSAMVFVTSLVNLGESNRLVSSSSTTLHGALERVRVPNRVLCAVGLGISTVLYVQAWEVGVAGALISLAIPYTGAANLRFLDFLRYRIRLRQVVIAQVGVTAVRVSLMVGLAAATGSMLAIAAAYILHAGIWALVLRSLAGRNRESQAVLDVPPVRLKERSLWAFQTVTQAVPGQADYLVLGIVGPAKEVGLYFLAYQATVAISLVAGLPLSKMLTGEFARRADMVVRRRFAEQAMLAVLLTMNLAVLALLGMLELVSEARLGAWSLVVPIAGVLLSSLPGRMLSPIADGYLLAGDHWSRSSILNVVDGLVTALVAATAIWIDIVTMASVMAVWKALLGFLRASYVLAGWRAKGAASLLSLALPAIWALI